MKNVIFVKSGEEPFTCWHCDITFAHSEDIEAHIFENFKELNEKHDQPMYICDQCGYLCKENCNSHKETQREEIMELRPM